MKIPGRIIELCGLDKNGLQLVRVKLDRQKTKELCTVREGERFCGSSCAGCSGCSHSSATGIFAVQGDELICLGAPENFFAISDEVFVEVPTKAQVAQGFRAIGLPVLMAVLGFCVGLFGFGSELACIASLFVGLGLGVGIALWLAHKRPGLPIVFAV